MIVRHGCRWCSPAVQNCASNFLAGLVSMNKELWLSFETGCWATDEGLTESHVLRLVPHYICTIAHCTRIAPDLFLKGGLMRGEMEEGHGSMTDDRGANAMMDWGVFYPSTWMACKGVGTADKYECLSESPAATVCS